MDASSPGSSRSIISPNERISYLHLPSGLRFNIDIVLPFVQISFIWPVYPHQRPDYIRSIYSDAGEARKTAMPGRSSGLSERTRRICSSIASFRCGFSRRALVLAVADIAGCAIALTLMLCGASRATKGVRPITALFEAV